MIKINIVCVGKVKEKYFTEAIDEYSKRLSRFCEFKIIELKEKNIAISPVGGEREQIIQREGEDILKSLTGFVVALCVEGDKISSEKFAVSLDKWAADGISEITFVIGGSYGLSEEVKKRAKFKLSFSEMTFPHTLFRVMLSEQIYRAFMINANQQYHK